MSWTKQDAVLTAVYEALERWDREERRVRTIRGITKGNFRRNDRLPNGTRIPTPRRSALARYLTDAALTAIRKWEAEQPDEIDPTPCQMEGCVLWLHHGGDHTTKPYWPRELREGLA